MLNKLIQFIKRPRLKYQPLIEVLVSRQAILHNLNAFRAKYHTLAFAPVLKSNAYGHGLVLVAQILDREPIPFFVVDSFFEALVLRRAQIKKPILILGYATKEQICEKNLAACAFTFISVEMLSDIAGQLTKPTRFHLKIDTGMSRQGILPGELAEAIRLIKSNANIVLTGVCSHLAAADSADTSLTKQQIAIWNQCLKILKTEFTTISYIHLAATAGAIYHGETLANVCRLGLGLYGFTTSPFDTVQLRPALELRTIMSSVKRYPAGARVGYNGTFTTPSAMTLATLPLGYNEGLDRRLSNKGLSRVGEVFCPIVGQVSMNVTSIDVSAVPLLKPETAVTVISSRSADKNSVAEIARLCDTIPYEILVHIPAYLRRKVV